MKQSKDGEMRKQRGEYRQLGLSAWQFSFSFLPVSMPFNPLEHVNLSAPLCLNASARWH